MEAYVALGNHYPHTESIVIGWTQNPIIMSRFYSRLDAPRNMNISVQRYVVRSTLELSMQLRSDYGIDPEDLTDTLLKVAYSHDNSMYMIYLSRYADLFEHSFATLDVREAIGSAALKYVPCDKYINHQYGHLGRILPALMPWYTTVSTALIDDVYLLSFLNLIKGSYRIGLPIKDDPSKVDIDVDYCIWDMLRLVVFGHN